MEKAFADSEAGAAAILGDLAPERLAKLQPQDECELRTFVAYQFGRTAGAAEEVANLTNGVMKVMMKQSLVINPRENPSRSSTTSRGCTRIWTT